MNTASMKQALASGLPQLERKLTDAQLDTFCAFGSALVEKNQVMNLTAITEPEQVARLHFLDCIALLGAANFYGKSVIDVGCGAGFPGVPLKIAEPSIDLTLLDSLKKRMDWLETTLPELGIEAQCVAARAEEYALEHREQYDIAVSRAVARLTMLAELCLPLVRVGGHFVAMKSADSDEELSQAARAIATLGGKVTRIWDYPVPGTDAVHRAVVITKVKATPKPYPRRFAKIKQQPL
jgi:16S rRNA (guanine527-N7)-methyltransferase